VLDAIRRRPEKEREREKRERWCFSLSGADLRGADFAGAYLEGAIAAGAHLEGAYLVDARLEGADLSKAIGDAKTRLPDGFPRPAHWPPYEPNNEKDDAM
jgi:hypothetical protein